MDLQQMEEDHQVETDRLNAIIVDLTKKNEILTAATAPAESVINWPEIVRKLEEEVAMLRKRLTHK